MPHESLWRSGRCGDPDMADGVPQADGVSKGADAARGTAPGMRETVVGDLLLLLHLQLDRLALEEVALLAARIGELVGNAEHVVARFGPVDEAAGAAEPVREALKRNFVALAGLELHAARQAEVGGE